MMQTQKLYYENCHLDAFSATVTGCREAENGYLITLSATAFYPEGGGQACDTGFLDGAAVTDVQEKDGEITHLCQKAFAIGQTVAGRIDWQRRLDLMQQHTGEHIVSGIINRRFGYHNVGFHVGGETVTIDFDGRLSEEDLVDIELEANRAVWKNLQVVCDVPPEEELPKRTYRSKRALNWPVRLVEIPGYDSCACCGVHVERTGEIGLIKLLSCVKFHQGVRLELVCGGRALSYLSKIYQQNRRVCQAFSAKPLETGAAAQRMVEALEAEKYKSAGLQKKIFASLAESAKGDTLCIYEDLAPGQVRELCDAIYKVCGGTAAVFSPDKEKMQVCLLGDADTVKALGAALSQAFSGRGGGKSGSYQGSLIADVTQIKTYFQENYPGFVEISNSSR